MNEKLEELKIQGIIDRFKWTFAKTMKSIPHEYTVKNKKDPVDSKDYETLYFYIQEHHYIEKFYGKPYKYCDIGKYKYWTMTDDVNESIIINRTLKKK